MRLRIPTHAPPPYTYTHFLLIHFNKIRTTYPQYLGQNIVGNLFSFMNSFNPIFNALKAQSSHSTCCLTVLISVTWKKLKKREKKYQLVHSVLGLIILLYTHTPEIAVRPWIVVLLLGRVTRGRAILVHFYHASACKHLPIQGH